MLVDAALGAGREHGQGLRGEVKGSPPAHAAVDHPDEHPREVAELQPQSVALRRRRLRNCLKGLSRAYFKPRWSRWLWLVQWAVRCVRDGCGGLCVVAVPGAVRCASWLCRMRWAVRGGCSKCGGLCVMAVAGAVGCALWLWVARCGYYRMI